MSPLALKITRQLELKPSERTFDDRAELLGEMADIHCFECSEILNAAKQIALKLPKTGLDERVSFLPAPKTWIEFRVETGGRAGFLLTENNGVCHVICAHEERYGSLWSSSDSMDIKLNSTVKIDLPWLKYALRVNELAVHTHISEDLILVLLAFINTPRTVGRTLHMPHAGLERRLLKMRKPVGFFPLNAWTTIKLSIAPPKDKFGQPSQEAHYTGQRAWHEVMAFLRVKNGMIEFVRFHTRGNKAIGIRKSRRVLKMPKDGRTTSLGVLEIPINWKMAPSALKALKEGKIR